jgi:chromosome partitioning protein
MTAVIVAVLNRKGGAGKTSLAKDLGFALADAGARILQIGLDPQSSLEVLAGLGFDTPPDLTVSRVLMPDEFGETGALSEVIHHTPWDTDLIPASKALATAERALSDPVRGGVSQRLKRGLQQLDVDRRYDLVLIDCPPGMTALTMNALVAAAAVLVPTQLDFLSVAGLAVLRDTVEEVREYDNPQLRYLAIVGTQVEPRTRHSREIRAQLEQLLQGDDVLCQATIRHSTTVRDAHMAHQAVGQFAPAHPVSQDYRDLATEIATRAGLSAEIGASAMSTRRADAESAVAGLFSRPSATGGLAGRRDDPTPTTHVVSSTLRQGVELTEDDVDFLRSVSRPSSTGQPRTLGVKFVVTGLLTAAVQLIREHGIDMDGVEAGDCDEMIARARRSLLGAAAHEGDRDA